MRKEDCLFCKIVAGEVPSTKVYEDERVLAFEDVSPQMPVHTLIVPKNHYDNIGDGIPDDEMGHLFNAVKKVAEHQGRRRKRLPRHREHERRRAAVRAPRARARARRRAHELRQPARLTGGRRARRSRGHGVPGTRRPPRPAGMAGKGRFPLGAADGGGAPSAPPVAFRPRLSRGWEPQAFSASGAPFAETRADNHFLTTWLAYNKLFL